MAQNTPNIRGLVSQVSRQQQQVNRIQQQAVVEDVDEEEVLGGIWDIVRDQNAFVTLTNFKEEELLDIVRDAQKVAEKNRKRGPPPKYTLAESILMLVTYIKLGGNLDKVAVQFNVKETTFQATLSRTREILLETLINRWWTTKGRPRPLNDPDYPWVALLVDSTSTEVFKPKGQFDESKILWDGKNKIYALKKEVAVSATSPHYAMFSQRYTEGSTHDYNYFKKHYLQYADYLLKTPEERQILANDREERRWGMLQDSAYIGPVTDTPELRRITLKKPSTLTTLQEQATNTKLAKLRVPVEQYFGRKYKLWGLFRGVYRLDHSHFDEYFDLTVLLTNEHIKRCQLEEQDYIFYRNFLTERKKIQEEKNVKRKTQLAAYTVRKKRRLDELR